MEPVLWTNWRRDLAEAVKVDAEQVRRQCCAVTRKLVERRLVLL